MVFTATAAVDARGGAKHRQNPRRRVDVVVVEDVLVGAATAVDAVPSPC